MLNRRFFLKTSGLAVGGLAFPGPLMAQLGTPSSNGLSSPSLPIIPNVDIQPLIALAQRIMDAMSYMGTPISSTDQRALEAAFKLPNPAASEEIQRILDRYCLVGVDINPEMRVKATLGSAKPELLESGWRQFLVKVHNQAGATSALRCVSPNAQSVHYYPDSTPRTASDRHFRHYDGKKWIGEIPSLSPSEIRDLWLDVMMFDSQPLSPALSGFVLEYRMVQLYSRDPGQRAGTLVFDVGQGTQDLGFRSEVLVVFNCLPAYSITWRVRGEDGAPVMAAFVIRDAQGRVYPSQSKRLAPDFAFHPQVYRTDGEVLKLPAGTYNVKFWRGPESITKTQQIVVKGLSAAGIQATSIQEERFQIERWIDVSKLGWWSGDHHIHAAGCAHYNRPTEGVHAEDMIRHTVGEDLKVGANLTWGPSFDYQKQFFTGKDDKVSKHPYLLHYDVEVSGFGSQKSGHLCLLRLKEQMYPGGDSDKHWPTLGLNTLRWAKKQGAVCGPAHSGWGLKVDTNVLPNYIVPPFDSIGANEYIMDVTHEVPGPDGKLVPAVDFMSTVDTPYVWELNMWYHTLNTGFRTRISGETDFPCIYDGGVGLGRSYVKLDGKLNYADWCEGIRKGRNYVGDGKSHLLDFKVSSGINNVTMGEKGSELSLAKTGNVRVTVKAAAFLEEIPKPQIKRRPYSQQPYWALERARIGTTREVLVEIVVNGYPVANQALVADGKLRDLVFNDIKIDYSSWVTVRILPSSHTNPIWVLVGNKPVRASRRSAEWCLKGVDKCWSQKEQFISSSELEQAKVDYEHARQTYRRILSESEID